MVAVVDVDKSRINSPSSSLPKSSGEDKCEPLPSHWRSPSIHLNAGEAMERRPRRSCLLVPGELPHDAGKTNGATNSARIPFSSPAYCASMQSKRRGQRAWERQPSSSPTYCPLADESHGNHRRDDEIDAAALLVSGDSPPHLPQIWRIW